MAKTFIQNGTGSSATLTETDSNSIPIFTTESELLANVSVLEVNQIVSCIETKLLYRIIESSGVKILQALTANGGSPVGAISAYYGTTAPTGWLICDGTDTTGTSNELSTAYPELYALLGSNVLPDLRECVLVGIGTNLTHDEDEGDGAIASHDTYTLGEFKDDQFQGHYHQQWYRSAMSSAGTVRGGIMDDSEGAISKVSLQTSNNSYIREATTDGMNRTPRIGTTTHGKQIGINYIIKAL